MVGLHEKVEPRFSWPQVEAALLKLPLEQFGGDDRVGSSRDSGLAMVRARISDALRRELGVTAVASATPAGGV